MRRGVAATHAWARALRGWGYAALVLDSFGARGLRRVCESGGLTSEQRVDDAFAALQTLAAHPGIDAGRVGGPTFRALIAFYPRCEARFPPTPLPAPLRIHIGAIDDWTPAPPCETLVAMLNRARADVRITVYPDSHHGFDSSRQGPPIRLPNVWVYGHGQRGATVGPNPVAAKNARDNVRRELAELFGS